MQVAEIEGLEFEVKGYSNAAINSLDKLFATLSKFKTLGSNFSGAIKKVSSNIKSLSETVTGSKFASGLKTFNSALTATIKAIASLTGKMGKMGLKGMGSLISLPFKQAGPKVVGFAKKLSGVLSGFKRIVGYRIIRSIIREITQGFQEGIKNLYGWSQAAGGALINGKTFAQTMDGLATSLAYLKNSIGAAAAPFISILAPAIDFIIDKAVALINVINQLIALLSGAGSWNMAIRKATEYGDAVGGAGGAAKKALEYLAPFDELNVLPDDKSGGGGGGGTDYSGMFEETTVFAEGLKNFADSIRAALEDPDSPWQSLGVVIGEKINEIIESVNYGELGTKVGSGINALFTTRYWTLDTINFTNIGSKIAEFLNNALDEIDFETIGRTFVQQFEALVDTIIGFVEEADWGLIASSIADTISGFFKEIGDWFTETDFATLADSIWNGIKDAVASVDWGDVVSSIVSALGAAIGGIGSFLVQLGKDILTDLWTAIKNAAATWDDGDGELTGQEIINGIWEGIKNAVKNVGQWIKDNIFTPFVNGVKDAFVIRSPAETMVPIGENIIEGIKEGIKAAWNNIKDWVLTNVYNPLAEAWNSLVGEDSPFALPTVTALVQLVRDGWTTVTGWILEKYKGLNVGKKVTLLRDGWTTVTGWILEKFAGLKVGKKVRLLRDDWDTVTGWILKSFAGLKVGKKVRLLRDDWTNVAAWVLNFKGATVGKYVSLLKYGWTTIGNWINQYPGVQVNKNVGLTKTWDTVAAWVDQFIGGAVSVVAELINPHWSGWQTPTMTVNASVNYGGGGRALGGIFENGVWHDLPQYAKGGRVHGSVFVAGEAGPEIVGHVGGRTEVLNRSQLAATMYSAVRSAMAGVAFRVATPTYSDGDGASNEEILYRAMRRALSETDFGGDIELDGEVLYKRMVNRNRANTRMTGVNAMA